MKFPVVQIWRPLSTGEFAQVANIRRYSTLDYAPTHLDFGTWSLTMPFSDNAVEFVPGRLVTIDWRGRRTTWMIGKFNPHVEGDSDDDAGQPILTVSGIGAFGILGWFLAFADPSKTINAQAGAAAYKGAAETVIKQLVTQNLVTRNSFPLTVPATQSLGKIVTARPVMDKLSDLVIAKAKVANLAVDINLVNTSSSTRAKLQLQIRVPVDKTKAIRLTKASGGVRGWDQSDDEPTATQALVAGFGTGGMDRFMQWVTTPESVATATRWNGGWGAWDGHREIFVDGPSSTDTDEITTAGEEQLTDGAATRTLTFTSAEGLGRYAFQDYNEGDKVTGEVVKGSSIQEVITSIAVSVSSEGISVVPVMGDPAATDVDLDIANIIGKAKAGIRSLERKT